MQCEQDVNKCNNRKSYSVIIVKAIASHQKNRGLPGYVIISNIPLDK